MNRQQTLVNEMAGKQPALHPTDKKLVIFTNGADHFVCPTPEEHEKFMTQPVLRKANEDEIKHHRELSKKQALITPFLW